MRVVQYLQMQQHLYEQTNRNFWNVICHRYKQINAHTHIRVYTKTHTHTEIHHMWPSGLYKVNPFNAQYPCWQHQSFQLTFFFSLFSILFANKSLQLYLFMYMDVCIYVCVCVWKEQQECITVKYWLLLQGPQKDAKQEKCKFSFLK